MTFKRKIRKLSKKFRKFLSTTLASTPAPKRKYVRRKHAAIPLATEAKGADPLVG